MTRRTPFSAALDAELRHADTVRPASLPHLGRGLSAGVWQALERDVLPINRAVIRQRYTGSASIRLCRLDPDFDGADTEKSSPRWRPQQLIAMAVFRKFGATTVHKACDAATVKRAYWALARALHPDRCSGCKQDAHQRFCELQQAWEVLRTGPNIAPKVFTPLW